MMTDHAQKHIRRACPGIQFPFISQLNFEHCRYLISNTSCLLLHLLRLLPLSHNNPRSTINYQHGSLQDRNCSLRSPSCSVSSRAPNQMFHNLIVATVRRSTERRRKPLPKINGAKDPKHPSQTILRHRKDSKLHHQTIHQAAILTAHINNISNGRRKRRSSRKWHRNNVLVGQHKSTRHPSPSSRVEF